MGGMGPMATIDLMRKIILATKASVDQEHVPVLVDSTPQIPDRTQAIIGKGKSPVPAMIDSAKRLEKGGSEFILIACNTAHYFLSEIQKEISIPIISIIDVAVNAIENRGVKMVGIIATDGTIRTKLYQKKLIEHGIKCLVPPKRKQMLIDDMIYNGVKANNFEYDSKPVKELLADMQAQGAGAFVLGCTEMPLAVSMYDIKGDFIDPTEELAQTAVKLAGGKYVSLQ